jgi:hypothetical protein
VIESSGSRMNPTRWRSSSFEEIDIGMTDDKRPREEAQEPASARAPLHPSLPAKWIQRGNHFQPPWKTRSCQDVNNQRQQLHHEYTLQGDTTSTTWVFNSLFQQDPKNMVATFVIQNYSNFSHCLSRRSPFCSRGILFQAF